MPTRSLYHQRTQRRQILQQYQRRDKPTEDRRNELVWKIALCVGISDTITRRMRPPQGRNQSIEIGEYDGICKSHRWRRRIRSDTST